MVMVMLMHIYEVVQASFFCICCDRAQHDRRHHNHRHHHRRYHRHRHHAHQQIAAPSHVADHSVDGYQGNMQHAVSHPSMKMPSPLPRNCTDHEG